MAQDFSDPLTSAAYTSSKIESGSDPLLAPVSTPTAHVNPLAPETGLSTPATSAKSNEKAFRSNDPLSSPTSSRTPPPPLQQHAQAQKRPVSSSSATKPRSQQPSPVPQKKTLVSGATSGATAASSTTKVSRSSTDASSLATPSSSSLQQFSDPLLGGDDYNNSQRQSPVSDEFYSKPSNYNNSYAKGGSSSINDSGSFGASNNNTGSNTNRATIASYPTNSANYIQNPNRSHSPVPIPTAVSGTGVNRHSMSSTPPSPSFSSSSSPSATPRMTRRDSSYEQQRVQAPQYLHIMVSDPDRRAKDGMFVLSVRTNMPRYKRQSYNNVTRSYLEFVRLREHLVAEHPEVIVPVLPPERSLISAATDVHSMRLFLERISQHPVLSQDYELQMFVESEFGFLPPVKTKKILGKLLNIGVKRFSSGGSTGLSLGGGGSTDTDDEFEEERTIAAKVETKLQAVIKNLDKEIKARRDFSSREAELATLSNVGGDATVLGSFLEYKLQHVQTLSGALDYRLSVLGEYDAAIKSTESKRKTMERLRSSTNINPEKVTDSIDDLEDGNMKMRMEQVSSALAKDLEEYKQQSEDDLLRALRQYSQRQVGFERAKLEELLAVTGGLVARVDEGNEGLHDQDGPENPMESSQTGSGPLTWT
ncbi:Vacuolar protein sorting-associated protein 17 [Mortierella polycephala]|uniref:Vacuolar protein sorting-associated protein 17 n=1 Tax=Mortierella polycephala TaxID=41804 RepID=A0A9P6Q0S1_9FUNG|nr:Vacuolar protein sorting-associated protein 17 [Mortierella polycephala]